MSFVNPTPDSELDAERSARSQPAQVTSNGNNGHGWVFPRPDGMKTRCGGPAICSECAKDQARKYASEHEPHVPLSTYESAVKGRQDFRKAYVGARQLLKRFVDGWEGVPGHENMDRLCEIARGLSDDSDRPAHAQKALEPRDWVIVCGDSFYGINGAFVMLESNARGFQSCADAQDFAKGMRCPWSVRERSATAQGNGE